MVDAKTEKLDVYPLARYGTVERENQQEEDNSVPARLERLNSQYKESGMRRSVEALMIVTHQGVPHVLVTQVANAFYKLPGGYLDPTESFEDGLITRLNEQLGVPQTPSTPKWLLPNEGDSDWRAGECVSTWYRPNFDTFFYPYLPPQHTQPKEVKKVFIIHLPPKKIFGVPNNMKLHAIPAFELYDNAARYGPLFAGIPHILSRYPFYLHESEPQIPQSYLDDLAARARASTRPDPATFHKAWNARPTPEAATATA